jgi:hypothetical protein
MTVSQQVIIKILLIQAERAALSYRNQVLNQMYAYYDEDVSFNLLGLI